MNKNIYFFPSYTTRYKLEDYVAELLDNIFYIQDIFNLRIDLMSEVLTDHLLKFLALPQFVGSLQEEGLQVRFYFEISNEFYIKRID